jgi:hypothetical protein
MMMVGSLIFKQRKGKTEMFAVKKGKHWIVPKNPSKRRQQATD